MKITMVKIDSTNKTFQLKNMVVSVFTMKVGVVRRNTDINKTLCHIT